MYMYIHACVWVWIIITIPTVVMNSFISMTLGIATCTCMYNSNNITYMDNIKLLLSVLSAIPGNITSSLPGIVYECVTRVNNAIGNE